MIYEELTLPLQITTMALGVWALIRLWLMRRRKWMTKYTAKEKITWRALAIGSLVVVEEACENLIQHNLEGPRLILRIIFLIFVVMVTHTRDDRRIVVNNETHSDE